MVSRKQREEGVARDVPITSIPERVSHENRALLEIGRIAVSEAMWVALRARSLPWTAHGKTSRLKLFPDDPAKAMDMAAEEAITRVIARAIATADTPLSGGCLLVTEEKALVPMPNPAGGVNEDLVVFVDPVDYTAGASRGLDGSVLLSFYETKWGFRAAVVGDLFRRRLYSRSLGSHSTCMTVHFSSDPADIFAASSGRFAPPSGTELPLSTTHRETLAGASVNVFVGKPSRLVAASREGAGLWAWKGSAPPGSDLSTGEVGEVFSVGGSLGPIRVADGTWDASIEIAKGFRIWDFAPGAFIAHGAGAVVVDEKGNDLNVEGKVDRVEECLADGFTRESLERSRQKFVVAATKELAQEIVVAVGGNKDAN